MPLFHPENAVRSERHRSLYARYELARTVVDFLAALCFVVGSLFYFTAETTLLGTWLFLVGSILFAVKPTIKLARELALRRLSPGEGEASAAPPPR